MKTLLSKLHFSLPFFIAFTLAATVHFAITIGPDKALIGAMTGGFCGLICPPLWGWELSRYNNRQRRRGPGAMDFQQRLAEGRVSGLAIASRWAVVIAVLVGLWLSFAMGGGFEPRWYWGILLTTLSVMILSAVTSMTFKWLRSRR